LEERDGWKNNLAGFFARGGKRGDCAARTMGFGDRHHADEMAVEAMRKTMTRWRLTGRL